MQNYTIRGNQMSARSLYSSEIEPSTPIFVARNIVTVARALHGKRLNKTIYADGTSKPYDNAFRFKYFSIEVEDLLGLCELVQVLLHKPQSCLIRGIAIDDSISNQRRLLYYDKKTNTEPTIIEQPLNWYALDIDGVGVCTGDLKVDTRYVLLALGLQDVTCFSIPSASYGLKPGIRIRLFLWNDERITCLALKKHFTQIVDPALFHPIQPIYTARPTFVNRSDPCVKLLAWIPGDKMFTSIREVYTRDAGRGEERYTKKQAEIFVNRKSSELWSDTPVGQRHNQLYGLCIFFGKLIGQGLIEEDETIEFMLLGCQHYWKGDAKRDHQTIVDGIKRGKDAMEEEF